MYNFFKLIFDYALAIILLIVLSPLILTISFIILLIDGFPIFFIQERQGINGKFFKIIKFRTMLKKTKNDDGIQIKDHERVTKLGNLLRKTSLDELPTLLNILLGQMSFVGPRPLLSEYDKLYNNDQRKRFDVKPGITGWAQINGRNSISWQEKFKLDIWYVKNRNLVLDFKILFKTIFKVFNNKDINSSETETMDKFKGTY